MKNCENNTVRLSSHTDARGSLIAIESKKDIPFAIKRAFVITNVPAHAARGGHAYARNEFALCLRGSCSVRISDGVGETTVVLDRPDTGLLIPGMTWRTLYGFSPDCVLFVFSDALYDPADCIDDYGAFLRRIGKGDRSAV